MRGTTGQPWIMQRRPYLPMTCADERCGAPFVGRHPAQRYCSLGCQQRVMSQRYHRRRRPDAPARANQEG